MREINRTIVSAIILSKDRKILMGKKDPAKGGVWPNMWHIPGGGVDKGETLEQALTREVKEEVGLDISDTKITPLNHNFTGTTEKTIKDTGERVLCHMLFNHFEVQLNKNANKIELHLSDDLVESHWFTLEELPNVKQIPGSKEWFEEMGYIKKA
jgi:8-oxo-dGTP pyrophosphatase MutT (NUDIX family)